MLTTFFHLHLEPHPVGQLLQKLLCLIRALLHDRQHPLPTVLVDYRDLIAATSISGKSHALLQHVLDVYMHSISRKFPILSIAARGTSCGGSPASDSRIADLSAYTLKTAGLALVSASHIYFRHSADATAPHHIPDQFQFLFGMSHGAVVKPTVSQLQALGDAVAAGQLSVYELPVDYIAPGCFLNAMLEGIFAHFLAKDHFLILYWAGRVSFDMD